MKIFKIITKLTLLKYQNNHHLIITCNIITQIALFMPYNENIKWDNLGQEKVWFCNLATLLTVLAEVEFSCHPLTLTNCTPHRFGLRSTNQTVRAQQEAEGEESNLVQKTLISDNRCDSLI